MKNNEEIEIVRNSAAFALMSILSKFYGAVPALYSITNNGFYVDFDTEKRINEKDIDDIQNEVKKNIKANIAIEEKSISVKEAIKIFKDKNYIYTVEQLENFLQAGKEEVKLYEQENFAFVGENIKSAGCINADALKLNSIAGVYWGGDDKNKMIQRVYAVVFESKKDLVEYNKMTEEAEKRDHRKLGKDLDLFHVDETVGLGLPLWHPKGAILWRVIEEFWYREHLKNGYQLVRTPHIGNKKLWETSGHWGFYNESMYPPIEVGQTLKESQNNEKTKESEQFLLKPMNCPFHIQIFKNKPHSYRELPLRWAECGTVYRYEKKGELSGLTRVRGFTQDDAHIICTPDQVEAELKKVVDFILFIYKSFGFDLESINVYLSVRDPELKKYAGNDEGWDITEKILEKVAKEKKLNISKDVGGAVFYGPKLDFKIKDAIGREWQCSTLQFDFNLPERFNMTFINAEGQEQRPYMLHRALFGSFERFIGVLIEHYAGALPIWLSPVQVKIIPVTERHIEYCQKMANEFLSKEIRVELDSSSETVGNRIRKSVQEKIPYTLVVGDKEMASDKLSIRDRGSADIRGIKKDDFFKEIKDFFPIK